MTRLDLGGVCKTGRGDDFRKCFHGIAMKMVDALGLLRHHQCPLALRILCRYPDRAAIGVTALGLDAADREHEAARGVAPVSAHCHGADNVEG